jgi:hypothetical protein
MTSRELHDWVEKQGVPAKWQMPVVQLLRGLLEEERVWPTVRMTGSLVQMHWLRTTIHLAGERVTMFLPQDSGPGSQMVILGPDWVREALRLAPKKPDTLREVFPFSIFRNEKPAPPRVGGYRIPITPRPTFMHRWADVYLQSGVVIRAGDILVVDQSGKVVPA